MILFQILKGKLAYFLVVQKNLILSAQDRSLQAIDY